MTLSASQLSRSVYRHDNYLSNAPHDTPLAEFTSAVKGAHRIEECFHRAKGESGFADYEVRTWRGWHQHQMLSPLANRFLTLETQRGESTPAITLPHDVYCSLRRCIANSTAIIQWSSLDKPPAD